MNETRNIIVGLEIGEKNSQICYFSRQEKMPISIAPKLGSNQYLLPTALSKKPEGDVWHIGLEAEYFTNHVGDINVDSFFEVCSGNEPVMIEGTAFEPFVLLAHFIEEALKMLGVAEPVKKLGGLMVVTRQLSGVIVRNLQRAFQFLGMKKDKCFIQDYEESFYYFVLHQKPECYSRKVAWLSFTESQVTFATMHMDTTTKPVMVSINKGESVLLPQEPAEWDLHLYQFLIDSFGTEYYSGIFIEGNGFEKEWAVRSIPLLCKNQRKVFYGEGMFVNGACYAAKEKLETHALKNYLYSGSALVRVNVGMIVLSNGAQNYFTMIDAGNNWYEVDTTAEIILDDTKELVFQVNHMTGAAKNRHTMSLPGIPERPNKTTRLRIHVTYESAVTCVITVHDLGFGEMYPAEGKVWIEKVLW